MSIPPLSREGTGNSIHGLIKSLLDPYPFERDISIRHPSRKIYILTGVQIEKVKRAILDKFRNENKEPSIKDVVTDVENIYCITVRVGGHTTRIFYTGDE